MNDVPQAGGGTALEQRRVARRKSDPHHKHPFRRLYIGPSPVSARSAVFVASAIAQDVQIDHPVSLGVVGGTGTIAAASIATARGGAATASVVRGSLDSIAIRPQPTTAADVGSSHNDNVGSHDEAQSDQHPLSLHKGPILIPAPSRQSLRDLHGLSRQPSPSPARRARDLSPLQIPRNSIAARQDRLSRNVSHADSIRSRTGSVEHDDGHGILRHNRKARRQMSQSMIDPRSPEHDTVKFDLFQDGLKHQHRQYSEGSAYHVAHAGPSADTSAIGRQPLPLLDVSADEDGAWHDASPTSSPRKVRQGAGSRQDERRIRPAASFLSVGAQSTMSESHASGREKGVRGKASASTIRSREIPAKLLLSSPDARLDGTEEWTGNGLTNDSSTLQISRSRMEEMRERARERYRRARIGQKNVALGVGRPDSGEMGGQGGRRQHIRDASRQSRLSYLSTAGTLTSVGTRFTEGSFGASGGFRAKLVRTFGRRGSNREPTSQSVRAAEAHRRGSHGGRRSSVGGGVVPGAVGTSAGGTKWIGQTFEVGKRFWEAVDNREQLLLGSATMAEVLEEVDEEEEGRAADTNAGEAGRGRSDGRAPLRKESDLPSMMRSPSDILSTFAQEARGKDEDAKGDPPSAKTDQAPVGGTPPKGIEASLTPALLVSGSDSEQSDGMPVTPDHRAEDVDKLGGALGNDKEANGKDARPTLERVRSAASLLTVPQDREAQSGWDIESRNGWNDVVSFITAQTNLPTSLQRSARSAGDNLNEMGSRAKRAFDGQLAEFRARQAAGKQSRANTPDGGRSTSPRQLPSALDGERSLTTMRPIDVLIQPEPPMGVEDKFAEATFALTRRPSFPGVLPLGEKDAVQNDAASDHEVAARPTFEAHESGRSVVNAAIATPTELPSLPVDADLPELPSAMQASGDSRERKTVQFSSNAAGAPSDRLAPPQRSMTLSALPPFGSDDKEKVSSIFNGRMRPTARSGDAAPVPPEEVLSRDATPDERTSLTPGRKAGRKSEDAREEVMVTHKSTLKRDRMLVKVAWTPSEDVPKEFTERESRKYELHADPLREYMVVFRTGRLELWDDPTWTSRALGHADQLKLRLVAPLRRGRTFVSLYSPIDTIFCVSFVVEHHRSLLGLRRSGTHIWLFDARASSCAADWMWELWRELGGQIPDAIDVQIPVLGFRIRVPIPEEMPAVMQQREGRKMGKEDAVSSVEGGEGYKVVSKANVVEVVMQLAHALPQWAELCARLDADGIQFGLAWRTQSTLSWVQHSLTVDGHQRRDWAVLVGSILCDTKAPSTLEFRSATHYPQRAQTARGHSLDEPPSLEGFLWRVKAVSGSLTRLYVTTQDGLLFINRPSRAFPPERHIAIEQPSQPSAAGYHMRQSTASLADVSIEHRRRRMSTGRRSASRSGGGGKHRGVDDTLAEMGRDALELITSVPTTIAELDAQVKAFRSYERRRMYEQIIHSDGYVDVRDIFTIRSLDENGPVRHPCGDEEQGERSAPLKGKKNQAKDDTAWLDDKGKTNGAAEEEAEEAEDVGGEEGYSLVKDRAALKRCRQIEITMSNGRTIRFEAYSRSVAGEWIEGLANLAQYWKRREKIDALELMHASGQDPSRSTLRKLHPRPDPRPFESSVDSERMAPLLGNVWNMCILDSCRTVLRSGRLFTKKKPYAAFDNRYCLLVTGRILTYKLMTSQRTARLRQNAGIFHKRQDTVIHLRDSYVYSGKLTDHMLVNGRSNGAGAISNFGGGSGGATTSSTRHTLPRIYADGLLSVDEDEECTFVIRYRPQRVNQSAEPQVVVDAADETEMAADAEAGETGSNPKETSEQRQRRLYKASSVTTLRDSTMNVIAMRARSRMERDLWVWAINAERERLVRNDKVREEQIRQHGQTPYRASKDH